MQKLPLIVSAFLMMVTPGFAAEQTWTGTITDTMCSRSHESNIEHAQQRSGKKMTDQECAVGCVMNRGQRYVLVVGVKTYQIENQEQSNLAELSARLVKVTGSLSGGTTIKVSKIVTAGKSSN
jgi:hypothetical protein